MEGEQGNIEVIRQRMYSTGSRGIFFPFPYQISSLDDGRSVACCTSHEAWVTDIAFGKSCSQLVTVSNNIQVNTTPISTQMSNVVVDVFHKWRLWHGNEARMPFSP